MSDSATNPARLTGTDTARAAEPPRPYTGPVFIGDALTPLAGSTLLHLLWRTSDR